MKTGVLWVNLDPIQNKNGAKNVWQLTQVYK